MSDAKIIDGKVIAGTIVVYEETDAVYYYGASSNQHRNVMAPYLLQWKGMQDAKKAGKKWYDFMGVAKMKNGEFDTSDELYGVTEFKQKFGGEVMQFEKPVDVIINPFWYYIVKLAKKLRG